MTARLETLVPSEAAAARAQEQNYMERFRAPFSLRCGALLIDYILLAGIIAFSTLVARMGGHPTSAGTSAQMFGVLVAAVVAAINFVGLPVLRGQTLGKWATGLVVRRTDGERLSWGRSLLRHLPVYPPFFLIVGLGLLVGDKLLLSLYAGGAFALMLAAGFLVATFSAHGRALHDLLADTVVVREKVRRTRRIR